MVAALRSGDPGTGSNCANNTVIDPFTRPPRPVARRQRKVPERPPAWTDGNRSVTGGLFDLAFALLLDADLGHLLEVLGGLGLFAGCLEALSLAVGQRRLIVGRCPV